MQAEEVKNKVNFITQNDNFGLEVFSVLENDGCRELKKFQIDDLLKTRVQ